MHERLDSPRFEAPDIVNTHMQEGKTGLEAGRGFYDFTQIDKESYRHDRLAAFVALLQHMQMIRAPK